MMRLKSEVSDIIRRKAANLGVSTFHKRYRHEVRALFFHYRSLQVNA